jgi:hypothetical protein
LLSVFESAAHLRREAAQARCYKPKARFVHKFSAQVSAFPHMTVWLHRLTIGRLPAGHAPHQRELASECERADRQDLMRPFSRAQAIAAAMCRHESVEAQIHCAVGVTWRWKKRLAICRHGVLLRSQPTNPRLWSPHLYKQEKPCKRLMSDRRVAGRERRGAERISGQAFQNYPRPGAATLDWRSCANPKSFRPERISQ